MRFDEPQTDAVYDNLIRPALTCQGITPIRIDRVEHNDNIDARIIQEIEGCDLALGDLTFARPSVYFEAGFAEGRSVPVIYTCRKDHFTPKPDDTLANLRVHFDLQMKNIIPWNNEKDSRFMKKLTARIKKVIRPILMKKARLARENESQLQFSRLSLVNRLFAIRNTLNEEFKSAGFRHYSLIGARTCRYWLRNNARGYTLICDWAGDALPKKDLRKASYDIIRDAENISEQYRKSSRPVVHVIVCSLKRTPPSRVHGAIEHFAQDQHDPSLYVLQTETMWMIPAHEHVQFFLHTIDSIRSENDFSERLEATLAAI
jgi:nucleoside 2-deoxyribosyltransferase